MKTPRLPIFPIAALAAAGAGAAVHAEPVARNDDVVHRMRDAHYAVHEDPPESLPPDDQDKNP